MPPLSAARDVEEVLMDAPRPRVRSPFRRGAIHVIQVYRAEVSPQLGASCRFSPTCSQYGLEAFERHSFPVASAMTIGRIARCHDPIRPRTLARAVAALGVFVAAVVGLPMLVGSAFAQVSGPCTATLAGVDAATASTPEDAVEVGYDEVAVVAGTMTSGPVSYDIQLEFAGFRWTAASGEASGNTWSDEVNIADYATHGVGLYKVHAESTNAAGETCTVDGYVDVTGKSPFTTTAGIAGTTALGGGVALVGVASLRAAKPMADYDLAPSDRQFREDLGEEISGADPWRGANLSSKDPPALVTKVMKPKCSLLFMSAMFLTLQALMADRGRRVR
jgi:putative membrane protein insertion efficiency factor